MKLFECFRYESALLLNKIYDVPVFPVFLAEMKADNEFVRFELNHEFPDVVHKRNDSTQIFVDSLRYGNKEQSHKEIEIIPKKGIFLKVTHHQLKN